MSSNPGILMKFTERVNKDAVDYLLNFSDAKIIEMIMDYQTELQDQNGRAFDKRVYVKQVKAYLQTIKRNGYSKRREYAYSTSLARFEEGRIFVKDFGIQSLQYKLRGFLVKNIYTDYDIINCFPTLLLDTLKEEEDDKPDSTMLQSYVDNRDKILKRENLTKINILISIFNDRASKYPNEWLKKFDKEIKKIQYYYYDKFKKKYENAIKSSDNPKGSLLNILLSIKENEILQKVISYCRDHNIDVGVPMYDGMLIEKLPEEQEEKLIKKFNKISKQHKIKWIIKPHNNDIFIDEEELQSITLYKNVKEVFETNYFMTKYPLAFWEERICHTDGMRKVHPYKKNEFTSLVGTFRYEIDDKEKAFFPSWEIDKERRCFDTIDFLPPPLEQPENVYNLFKGLKYESWENVKYDENTDTDIFYNHIKLLCNYDENVFNFILDFLAHLLLKTAHNPQVAILFKSTEGIGKNIFFDNFMEQCIGLDYYKPNAKMDDLTGNFVDNSTCIMSIVNELNGCDGFKQGNDDKLKELITAKYCVRHDKGMKKINNIRNCMRILLFTNGDWSLKVSTTDRRYAIIECCKKLPPPEYFKALGKAVVNKSQLLKLIDELKKRDVPDVFNSTHIPETKYKNELASMTIPNISRFLQDRCETYIDENNVDGELKIKDKDLHKSLSNFIIRIGGNVGKHNSTNKKLEQYDGISRARSNKGIYWKINVNAVIQSLKDRNEYEVVEQDGFSGDYDLL